MPFKYLPRYDRPRCPDCDMSMIVTAGINLDPERKTFECLRCGRIEKPSGRRAQAAE
jgi:hypothetical protein